MPPTIQTPTRRSLTPLRERIFRRSTSCGRRSVSAGRTSWPTAMTGAIAAYNAGAGTQPAQRVQYVVRFNFGIEAYHSKTSVRRARLASATARRASDARSERSQRRHRRARQSTSPTVRGQSRIPRRFLEPPRLQLGEQHSHGDDDGATVTPRMLCALAREAASAAWRGNGQRASAACSRSFVTPRAPAPAA